MRSLFTCVAHAAAAVPCAVPPASVRAADALRVPRQPGGARPPQGQRRELHQGTRRSR